jgi:hypothetical protein
VGAGTHRIAAVARAGAREFREGYVTINYPGLDRINLYRPAVHETRIIDVKIAPGIRAGYIMGTGDEVPQALAQLGVNVRLLDTVIARRRRALSRRTARRRRIASSTSFPAPSTISKTGDLTSGSGKRRWRTGCAATGAVCGRTSLTPAPAAATC